MAIIYSNLLFLPLIICNGISLSELTVAEIDAGRNSPLVPTRHNYAAPSLTNDLIEFLAKHLRYPPSNNCNYQDEFKTWLVSCWQQDPDSNDSILLRVASFTMVNPRFGPDCRVSGQCGPTGQPGAVTLQRFQHHYLDRLTSVIRQDTCQQHFNAADLFKEANVDPNQKLTLQQFRDVITATGNRLLKGECIKGSYGRAEEPYLNEYLDAIFVRYSNETDDVTEDGIRRLLEDVGLKVSEDGETGEASSGVIEETTPASGSKVTVAKRSLQERLLKALQSPIAMIGQSDQYHRSIERRSLSGSVSNDTDMNLCLKSNEVLRYFDTSNSSTLDKDEFLQMLAYIVYQISTGNKCVEKTEDDSPFNAAEAYGYGTLCVFIVSACSALGFVVIPLLPASIYETMMACFIALAFGTLTADAVLHMLPECLITETETDGSQGEMAPPSFYKCLVITLSIYGLFVFEALTQLLVSGHSHKADHGGHEQHGHSHIVDIAVVKDLAKPHQNDNGALGYQQQKNGRNGGVQHSATDVMTEDTTVAPTITDMVSGQEQIPVCFGFTTLALVIIVGDAIHNVTDGIAVGASFAVSKGEGFSTALAVLFHELPHEFGDFVILLMTGMTLKRALVWNFLTSLTAFIGLYIGILVGQNETANQWIFAVTAGMFLYVAVADMLPELRNMKVKNRWQGFFAQNVGALVGIGFMVLMYFLEDLIHF